MFGIESYKNKDELLEEQYKAKYLKYKQKYNELKQTGGILPGIYAYLTTENKANELVALWNRCTQKEGTDKPFDIAVTVNIESKNVEFDGLVNKSINDMKSEYTKKFNDLLTKCNTPKSADINSLLNDNAYKIKNGTKKIELIHGITLLDKARNTSGAELKKNSSTIDPCKIIFNPDTPNSFKDILLKIQSSNIKKPNYTVPTHYVLIDESVMSSKLVGDGKPKPIPQ